MSEEKREIKDTTEIRKRWMAKLRDEKRAHKEFHDQATAAEKQYAAKEDWERKNGNMYPSLWSIVNTTHAALYSRPARPDVRKRNVDVMDGIDKQIAQMIERALNFTQDTTDFDPESHAAVNDFLVSGLGQAKIEMDVETEEVPVINPVSGQPIMDGDEPLTQTKVSRRSMRLVYFHHARFHWEPTTTWRQCSWVAFDHYMGHEQFEEQFGVEIPQDARLKEQGSTYSTDKNKTAAENYEPQYCVHEVWDKESRKVMFFCEQYPDLIEERDDPLQLEDFFPCPRPMLANCSAEEVLPKPDYVYIRDLIRLINTYSRRIANLTTNIKDVGFYDASFVELAKVTGAEDGTRIPIKDLVQRLNSSNARVDTGAVMVEMDNTAKAAVIMNLMEQRERAKMQLDEAIGISDITRGTTDPNETASAQRIKNQWANVRLAPRLNQIAQFFRNSFRIMAEILCQSFEPEQIAQMTGVEVSPEMQQVMQSDALRMYAVDIETDSTIAQDDTLEREQRNETSQTVSEMLQQLVPAMQAGQLPAGLAKALMLFTVRTTKYGREFEDEINQLPDTMQQLQGLQQQVQQGQEQGMQLQQQLQEAQGQLQQVNQQQEQRENVKTQSDAQEKQASTVKQFAEAQRIQSETRQREMFPAVGM